jgi:hypothetical protein
MGMVVVAETGPASNLSSPVAADKLENKFAYPRVCEPRTWLTARFVTSKLRIER